MRILLYGSKSTDIEPIVRRYADFEVVLKEPDAIICYGGDGTLLAAEREWPGVPKVPIRNSRRGNRMIAHPPADVIEHLVKGRLIRTEYCKLACSVRRGDESTPAHYLAAMNEVNVHMARINSAVRFKMWIDDEPYKSGVEILGDGFVISTAFGSTAYFNHITRGYFYSGIGIAFKSTSEHTNHVVVPDRATIRILITRGPALLTYDNAPEVINCYEGDELLAGRHEQSAVLYTWATMPYPCDAF
jgi:NAD+ kinase